MLNPVSKTIGTNQKFNIKDYFDYIGKTVKVVFTDDSICIGNLVAVSNLLANGQLNIATGAKKNFRVIGAKTNVPCDFNIDTVKDFELLSANDIKTLLDAPCKLAISGEYFPEGVTTLKDRERYTEKALEHIKTCGILIQI